MSLQLFFPASCQQVRNRFSHLGLGKGQSVKHSQHQLGLKTIKNYMEMLFSFTIAYLAVAEAVYIHGRSTRHRDIRNHVILTHVQNAIH